MLRTRIQYKPDSSITSRYDDVFLHSVDETDYEEFTQPPETGCIPPFIISFLKWLKLWKTDPRIKSRMNVDEDIV